MSNAVENNQNDLLERVNHLETFYAQANHDLQIRISELEQRLERMMRAMAELALRADLKDLGLDAEYKDLWEVVREALENSSKPATSKFMQQYWELLAKANHRHTIVANFSGEDENFYTFAAPIFADLDQKYDLVHPGAKVLDIGCGAGRVAHWLRGKVQSYVGVDISPTMVETATRYIPDENFKFIANDGQDLSFLEDNSITLGLSFIALQHMPEEVMFSYLREFGRVVADGGKLLFQLPAIESYPERRQTERELWFVLAYPQERITAFMEEQGFQVNDILTQGNDWNPTKDDFYVCTKLAK